MNNKFVKFYNQNRHMFWIVILVVIAVIVLVHILNNYVGQRDTNERNTSNLNSRNTTINNYYSVISGQEVDSDVKEVIDRFIGLCTNKRTNEAYEMLTDECKEALYPTVNDFEEKYYNRIFDDKKTYSCQAWITRNNAYTFKIDFIEDMLATGTPSKTSIVDYYTIQKGEDNSYKLNINKFIGSEEINMYTSNNGITIGITEKKVYMDYEIYDIEVTNNSKYMITLDNLQSNDNVYIEDTNGRQFSWDGYEILEDDITIPKGLNRKISIKFDKQYSFNNDIAKLVFSNIVLNNKQISMEVTL